MKRARSLLLIAVSLYSTAVAQSAAVAAKNIQQTQSSVAHLTNRDVLELQQAKLTSEEMIAKINASKCEFDLSPSALETLKNAGIRDEIIAVMVQAMSLAKNESAISPPPGKAAGVKIPAGTKLDIEAAYTVSSFDVRPGDLLSFRVLIPVNIDGVTVVEKGALVTARVVAAKRGGHWGKSGRLSWTMQDVVAVDGQRLPVQTRDEVLANRSGVKGTSHAGEIATKTVVLGVLLAPVFPIAPLALMQGFKRGENAVLPEGKRLVVFLQTDTSVKAIRSQLPE